MESTPVLGERVQPIGRGSKVRTAVLAATLTELAETGYAALSVDDVARRAGVHKTTIYRRWQTRENLVVEALAEQMTSGIAVPDTGDVATDLRELSRAFVGWMAGPSGRAMLATILSQDAARVPDIAAIKRRLVDERFRRAEPVVIRGIERGELPAGTDPAEVIKTLIAPIYLRLLVTAEPIDETTADQAARVALLAARAGVLQHPSETTRATG
jgi:AcrR family transcriptional regulator